MQTSSHQVTQLLQQWHQGEADALEKLLPIIYHELQKLAGSYLRNERPGHTLQPTALINEAYLRLVGQNFPEWQNRKHFFGVAAQLMRQILVEHARAHSTAKRGAGEPNLPLDEALTYTQEKASELVALDDALQALAQLDVRKARLIELRYFGGLSLEETAEVMDISIATIGREMRLAQAWLHRELSRS